MGSFICREINYVAVIRDSWEIEIYWILKSKLKSLKMNQLRPNKDQEH